MATVPPPAQAPAARWAAPAELHEQTPLPSRRGSRAVYGWVVLGLILLLGVPPFLRAPLWCDVLHYDFCARTVLRGGVLYRDAFDNNLPGITWMQAAVRAVVGWRPEMIRLADLLILAAAWALLLRWLPGAESWRSRGWTAAALATCYLSTSEICHCQRDGWLLLPACAALVLRDRQLRRLGTEARSAFLPAVAEGLCWGAALWIKPHSALVALVCWLTSVVALARTPLRAQVRALLRDAAGLLTGGLLAGALGLAWLAWTGAWSDFWDVLLVWDREYAQYTQDLLQRLALANHLFRTLPWTLLHFPALVLAVRALWRCRAAAPTAGSEALLGAFYLGLVFEGIFLQVPHEYVMIGTLFPAIVLVARASRSLAATCTGISLAGAFVLLVALFSPLLRPNRLEAWTHCWREPAGPDLRQQLTLYKSGWGRTDWEDLDRVAEYLRSAGVRDGELTCLLGTSTLWLYLELDVKPATRFDMIGVMARLFPGHAEQFRTELDQSSCRYIVSDMNERNLLAALPATRVPGAPRFLLIVPDGQPVAFRAGRYIVHRVQQPVTEPWWPKGLRVLGANAAEFAQPGRKPSEWFHPGSTPTPGN